MDVNSMGTLTEFSRAFNRRDWEAWARVVADDFVQSSEHAGELFENDKAGFLALHKRMTDNELEFRIISAAVNGSIFCMAWEFVKNNHQVIRGAGVGQFDADGRICKLKGLNT